MGMRHIEQSAAMRRWESIVLPGTSGHGEVGTALNPMAAHSISHSRGRVRLIAAGTSSKGRFVLRVLPLVAISAAQ